MKRKNPLSENATKGDLLILKREIETKLNDLEYRLDGKAQKYKDEILTELVGIAGDIGVLKDENVIGSGQASQLRDEVDNHEKRIKILEKIQQTA